MRVSIPVSVRAPARVPLLQVSKSAIAMVAAWLLALAVLPSEIPIFAAISALLVVQPSVNQSVGRGIERSLGVVVGVVVAYGIGLVFGRSSWIVLLAVVVAIFLAWALKLTPSTASQVPITAMLVLSIGAQTPGYAFARVIETILGAVIGIIVNLLVVPPVLVAPAHARLKLLTDELADTLDRLADALTRPQTPAELEGLLIAARLLRPMQEKTDAALSQGRESLTLNPRRSGNRTTLERDSALCERLAPIVTQTLGMTRTLRDHYDDQVREDPSIISVASEIRREAHDLRLLGDRNQRDAESTSPIHEEPALTSPLSLPVPNERHWILLGSLMEDVRRIREALLAANSQ